jgi:hypothetical protein
MKTLIVDVPLSGCTVQLVLRSGTTSGQAVFVLPDEVELVFPKVAETTAPQASPRLSGYTEEGFPPRRLTEAAIVQILREHGGKVKTRDTESGWNIYDEVAARLGVSIEARSRETEGTGEPAWRPEVGYCRKNLEQRQVIAPTAVSGRGIWQLAEADQEQSRA